MKILYFHQHFTTPTLGGGTRSYEFARRLIDKGHHVTMVCGKREGLGLPEDTIKNRRRGKVDGIEVIQIEVPYSNHFGLVKRTIAFLKFAYAGIKIAMKEDYDLLFATSTPLTAGIPGIFAKWFRRTPFKFVFEVRDLWPDLPRALGVKNPILLRGMSILEKTTYRKSDACIGLSPGICEGIRERAPKDHPVKLIPNGSDLDLFQRNPDDTFSIDGVDKNDVVAIFTGAHGIANGLDAVLDMAKVLQDWEIDHVKIVFVGDGKMKPHLLERKENENINNCIFLDRVSKFELNRIMNRADIGLMVLKNVPAFYYGTSPNKFFDYISASLPIVNNYPGWLADLIRDNQCGLAVEPDDPTAFADAVLTLADDPEGRIEMGRNARKLAEKEFAREKLAGRLVEFLEKVAGESDE